MLRQDRFSEAKEVLSADLCLQWEKREDGGLFFGTGTACSASYESLFGWAYKQISTGATHARDSGARGAVRWFR